MALIMAIGKSEWDFFLKSIDVWQIVESGWTPPKAPTAEWTIIQTHLHILNGEALNAICYISNNIQDNYNTTHTYMGMNPSSTSYINIELLA